MDVYRLIGLDQTEASIVRRRLRPWSKTDGRAIVPLLTALKQKGQLPEFDICEPRWETNVFPLYYWAWREVGSKRAYDQVLTYLANSPASSDLPKELRRQINRIANSEIDILIEDVHYFAFIEAKEKTGRQKIKFQDAQGVRQLVRQYVQGKILEKLIQKKFAIAAIGANTGENISFTLTPMELELLRLINDEAQTLSVVDLSWKSIEVGAEDPN